METPRVTLANGTTMPLIGFGAYQVRPGKQAANAINIALEAGYRSIDTAALYNNEADVGRTVRESGIRREQLFITTKLWNTDQGRRLAPDAFDASLELLGLDYVDLYLIHWYRPATSVETWRVMEEIYASGRAKAIGVSNYQIAHLEELAATAKIMPMVNQVELHPYLAQTQLRDYHARHNIATEAWGPLMQGGQVLRDQVVTAIAQSHGRTPAQVVLRWHVQQQIVAIPKSVTPERIRENLAVFDFELSDDEMKLMASLDREHRVGPSPDKRR
jgi:2,5-diketo-D-gluconate reductase A